ncbi:MAG: efflux RND transporter periplasmic adaptor subunit [Alphaproteobacteria bacterium]|nr:efflux RND transporter periplasmic adaptor subunit [Alphaproteobacteria bacterium]
MLALTMRICARALLLIIIVASPGASVQAGPGHDHDHGHSSAASPKKPINPRVTMTSDAYEFVGILKDHNLVIYLDRRADTSPVTGAHIELTVNDNSAAAELQPDGSYLFQNPVLHAHEKFEIVASVTEEGGNDLLVGTLDATETHKDHSETNPFGHDHAIHHTNESQQSDTQNALHTIRSQLTSRPLFVFIVGTLVGVLFSLLLRAKHAVTIVLICVGIVTTNLRPAEAGPGHDHEHGNAHQQNHNATQDAPGRTADGFIFIPKPTQRLLEIRTQILKPETVKGTQRLIGRVIADPNRNGLVQSTIRGRIKPPDSGLPVLGQKVTTGQTLALVEPAFEPIDASDVRQTAGDLEQRMAVLTARLARRRQLVDKKVASRASLQDLEIELAGLKIRRQQLDESRSKPEALRAPVSGVVADVRVVAGQVVASADTLYQIVDPDSFWVEAITFDPKLSIAASATALTSDNLPLQLSFVGRSRTLQQQATVLQYKIQTSSKSLSIGAPLTVSVETGEPVTGIIVSKDAVAEAPNGQRVVYVRHAPEKYRAVPVRAENLDRTRLHILAGLKAGDQIIVHGASLVSQIR